MRAMTDPLKKMLEEEQKKIDAQLRYRKDSTPDFKLPEKLPDILPNPSPSNSTPNWAKNIKEEDKKKVNKLMKKEKKKAAQLHDVVGEPTQWRGRIPKRRLK